MKKKREMSKSVIEMPPKGGFSFDLCKRNEMLAKKGANPPSFRKTGTTIVGLIFQVLNLGKIKFWVLIFFLV